MPVTTITTTTPYPRGNVAPDLVLTLSPAAIERKTLVCSGTGFANATLLSLLQRNWSGNRTRATLISPDDSKGALPYYRSWCVRCTRTRGVRRVEDWPDTYDGRAADYVSRGARSCRIAQRVCAGRVVSGADSDGRPGASQYQLHTGQRIVFHDRH